MSEAWCPHCGLGACVDADGVCRDCGATATRRGADEALRLRAEIQRLFKEAERNQRMVDQWVGALRAEGVKLRECLYYCTLEAGRLRDENERLHKQLDEEEASIVNLRLDLETVQAALRHIGVETHCVCGGDDPAGWSLDEYGRPFACIRCLCRAALRATGGE